MSYIRSGSNPEGLYIVGTSKDVEVMEGSKDVWHIPYKVFNGLIKKYDAKNYEPCSYGDAKIEEVWVCKDNCEILENDLTGEQQPIKSKMKLTYKEHYIYMWYVTWVYIVRGYIK